MCDGWVGEWRVDGEERVLGAENNDETMTTSARFERARAKPNGFQDHLLNHSDTMSSFPPINEDVGWQLMHSVGFEPTSTNTSELEPDPLDHSGILS